MINYLKEGNELSATQIFFDKFISKKKLTRDNKNQTSEHPIIGESKAKKRQLIKSMNTETTQNLRRKIISKIQDKRVQHLTSAKEYKIWTFLQSNPNLIIFFELKVLEYHSNYVIGILIRYKNKKKDSKISLDKQAKNTKAFSYLNQVKQKIKANFNLKSIPFTYHQSTDIFRIPKSNLPNITKVAIVNCLSLKFVQDFINEKYTRIQYCQTLKKYRLSLNQFKTDFRSNLFFCILSSEQKLIEYFFWLGIPIRSQEKQHIKSEIQNFFVQIINQQGQLSDFVKLNQGKNVILMDQKGRISYLQQNLIVECAQRVKVKQRERADSKYLKSSITAYLA